MDTPRILVVDDEEDISELVRYNLTAEAICQLYRIRRRRCPADPHRTF